MDLIDFARPIRNNSTSALSPGLKPRSGRDFDTGKYLGYCALTNEGFSATHPPADLDAERAEITRNFISFWVESLIGAGLPADKVYSHIAFMSSTMYRILQRVNPTLSVRLMPRSSISPRPPQRSAMVAFPVFRPIPSLGN